MGYMKKIKLTSVHFSKKIPHKAKWVICVQLAQYCNILYLMICPTLRGFFEKKFLYGFSFANTHKKQDCRGRGRAFL